MKILRTALRTLLLASLVVLGAAPTQAGQLSASVDRVVIAFNETLELRVRYESQTLDELNTDALDHDWEIVHNQRTSQLSFGGSQNRSYTQWSLTLLPRHKGKLLIPSLRLDGEVSNAIEVEVRDAASAASDQPVFIETLLDKQEVYVQEQVLLTVRFHTSVMLNNFSASDLDIPGARVLKSNESQYQKTIKGTTYTVVETTWAIFPDRSGDLQIPALRYSGAMPGPRSAYSNPLFARNGKQILLRSDASTVVVRPIPPDLQIDHWLPSKGMSLAQRWSRPVDQLVVGEPVTRSVILSAQGLNGAQLPPLGIIEADGFRLYPDRPDIEDQPGGNGVVGTRIESMAIVPTRPGVIHLPPLRMQWWDTVSGTLKETVLEGDTLTVAPAPASDSPNAHSAPERPEPADADNDPAVAAVPAPNIDPWLGLLLLSNLVLLGVAGLFAGLWWRNRTGKPKGSRQIARDEPVAEKAVFGKVVAIADQGRVLEFREQLLLWARLFWPDGSVHSLRQLAERAGMPELETELRGLDRFLFAGAADTNAPDIKAIIDHLEKLRRSSNRVAGSRPGPALKPLYPIQG